MLCEGDENMKKSFLNSEQAILTVMVQAQTPDRIKELIDAALPNGAEAFGMQFEKLKPEYQNAEVYKKLFAYTDKPVYVTNYRKGSNTEKTDDMLAHELLEIADCGATLCDVVGDLFDKQDDELAKDAGAIAKQEELIAQLHARGAEVLMSSHVFKFMPAEEVLKIALEHQRRGADISKIVVGAESMAEQMENLRIATLLKEKLDIPFLLLSNGECHILRRIGASLGCCMCLCVQEYDALATAAQPLLKNMKAIRDHMEG